MARHPSIPENTTAAFKEARAAVIPAPLKGARQFVEGPTGAGKSALAAERVRFLVDHGAPPHQVLILVAERSHARRYRAALDQSASAGPVHVSTFYGLATRAVEEFWPHIALSAGFGQPDRAPTFLHYETAQFALSEVVKPLLDQGYFADLSIRPQRLLSELLDNLNKAALNGYDFSQTSERLRAAWQGDQTRLVQFEHVHECIATFRAFALERNLLDFSLALETFHKHLVHNDTYWAYFMRRYRHLVFDNIEESVPVAQDFARRFAEAGDSTLLLYDWNAGYRVFLGVDAEGAYSLRSSCETQVRLEPSHSTQPDVQALAERVARALHQPVQAAQPGADPSKAILGYIAEHYRADVLRAVAGRVADLVNSGVAPGKIALVAPYLDGVLRFTMQEALAAADVPVRVVRRYESLRDEPDVRACLTLIGLAQPETRHGVDPQDLADALTHIVPQLDPIRATLLVRNLFDPVEGRLLASDSLPTRLHERVGYATVERYEGVRTWLETYTASPFPEPDYAVRSLFSELIAPTATAEQAGRLSALAQSMKHFRESAPALGIEPADVTASYVRMVLDGTVSAQYAEGETLSEGAEDGVILAPVHSFLLSGRAVKIQFWLDVASGGWWEPLFQPLTNPHILARSWPASQAWTDAHDLRIRRRTLFRLVNGLCHRCTEGLYVCLSEKTVREGADNRLARMLQSILA
ncbi:MAG: UvrD-helicase domain-containing protein [Bacteroidota bacterium]